MNFLTRVLIFFCLACLPVSVPTHTPTVWADPVPNQPKTDPQEGDSKSNPGIWFVSFYRNHISPIDGDRCPSVPSCSAYAVHAIKKHGFFMGWLMTVDRLIHEGSEEAQISPVVFSHGKWKIHDPVENNDFWWYPKENTPPN